MFSCFVLETKKNAVFINDENSIQNVQINKSNVGPRSTVNPNRINFTFHEI